MADRTRVQRTRAYSRSNWRSEVFQAHLWGGAERLEQRTLPSAPVAVNDSYTVPSGQYFAETASVLANDSSSDPTHLTASVCTGASHGSVMMASNGTFYYSSAIGYTGMDSFTYTAQDSNGSSTATVTLTVVQPAITISVTDGPNKTATVSGTVTGAATGTTVTISGVMSGSATTDSNGKYSYTGSVSALGTVTASFTDEFGGSDSSSASVTDPGPNISGLSCIQVGSEWELTGSVSDPWGVQGLIVAFGGPAAGYQATVDSNGNFEELLTFKPVGQVTAATQDGWSVNSNTATLTVDP